MSEEKRDDARRTVTSVGNSWIVCKSKSHQGHVYYFNTLTGEAAWNLSDAEIEKAKSRTKHLEGVPGSKPTRCPEPKDKPPSTPLNNKKPAQNLFHEPTVVNMVSEQQSSDLLFSNFANNAPVCSPIDQMSGVMEHPQINNPPSVNPVCNLNSLNNPLSAFNLNTTIYNPKVWDVPQMQQVFLPPTMAPVVNQNPASFTVAYNNLSQTILQPTSGLDLNSFENPSQSGIITRGTNDFYDRRHNYGQRGQQTFNKKFLHTNKNDLRQKLFARQRFNMKPSGFSGGSSSIRTSPRKNNISAHIASKVEGINSKDLSDFTLENRCLENQLHDSPSKIDLGPLKSLAPSDSNSDAWFLVVDLDVLLNEFKFLTTLTDSDELCHLMVPRRVMEELKTYVTCTENIQARRILRFLSQQIEIGYAFMAAEPSEVEGDMTMAEVILTTCTDLSENKYHLILLSNDNELLAYKDSSSINMFSIDEVKNLLMNNPNKQLVSSVPKKPFRLDSLINKIKITVPNDTAQNIDATSPVRDTELDDHIEDNTITQHKPKRNNTQDKIGESVVLKRTVDAGIQTDFGDVNAISISNVTEKQDLRAICKSPPNTSIIQSVSVFNVPEKKREIKLKRSLSNQLPVTPDCEKKQFKWRRRRNTTAQVHEEIPPQNDQNTNPKNVESIKTAALNIETYKQINNDPTTSERNENKTDDSIESRESSIYAGQRNSITKENVTIEETSTSGIISNSESNVDDESHNNTNSNVNEQQPVNNEQPQNKSTMYEIDSITMEEYLKMKCDEWVSRFIQIMEEVLSQVLQLDPPFSHCAMPAPWTLHEATQCVAIKFSGHEDIKVAANKLSNILFHVSDAKGKITMNMSPYQYMQMYSYGVHLLVAIKKVTNSCEDIQIAVDSLNKLLDDIRNPNMDSCTNDSFNDIIHDNLSNNEASVNSDEDDCHDESTLHEQELDCNRKHDANDLTTKKRKLTEEELPKPVKFIRNIDVKSSFFKHLSLQRTIALNNSVIENNVFGKPQVQSHQEQHPTNSHTIVNVENTCENVEKVTHSDKPTNEPKLIRNFSICPELEEKLKRNYNSKVNRDDDLDYEYDYGEYIPEEYSSEDENYNEQRNDVNETNVRTDTIENCELISPNVVDQRLTNDNSRKFKYMMCMLLQEIRNALCQVRILCDRCYEELKNPELSTEQKCQLRKMAERAHLHIIRLCRSLESMLDHETNNPTQNMCNLLKQADINICHVDEKLLFEYRITVAECKDRADEFLSSIENIISAFNS